MVLTKIKNYFKRIIRKPKVVAQVPIMITIRMKTQLVELGYTMEQIDRLTPIQANEILGRK